MSASAFLFSPAVCQVVSVVLISGGVNRAYLVSVAAHERAQSRLSSARGRVDVRLESGGVLVRHVVEVVVEGLLWLRMKLWLWMKVADM